MAEVKDFTMRDFRKMAVHSGETRVFGAARRRPGARPPDGKAVEKSPRKATVTGDGDGPSAGGDAASAKATATNSLPCAGVVGNKAEKAEGNGVTECTEEPRSLWDRKMELEAGPELPVDGAVFVDRVNARIDLVELAELQLRSRDEKVSGRHLEQLLEMKYGKNARAAESAPKVIFDLPRPERD